jgi:hypothetical protein
MATIEDIPMKARIFWIVGSLATASVFAQSSGGDLGVEIDFGNDQPGAILQRTEKDYWHDLPGRW